MHAWINGEYWGYFRTDLAGLLARFPGATVEPLSKPDMVWLSRGQ